MKLTALALTALLLSGVSVASLAGTTHVHSHYDRKGNYHQGYDRSSPDQYRYNNRGSQTNGGHQRDEFSNPPQYNQSYGQ
jgi:hypothetical protein